MNTDLTKMTLRALIVKKHTLMSKSPVTAEHIREFRALDRELTRRAMNKWRATATNCKQEVFRQTSNKKY